MSRDESLGRLKPETRNPRSEGNPKPEIRMQEGCRGAVGSRQVGGIGPRLPAGHLLPLRISAFGLPSGFGFRVSDLGSRGQSQAAFASSTPRLGQSVLISQPGQSGLRAAHRRRPCQISQWLNIVHCSCGSRFISSCSIFSGAVSSVRPSRCESRATCVKQRCKQQ